jgi:cytochrome c peroxidase
MALAAYQRSLISNNTPFDRFARGETSALSESARRGYEVFVNKANCITCHAGADFTDQEFRRIGIGWNGKAYLDPGRSKITGKEQDTGKVCVPALRELVWTAPYMHDGSLATLEEVVDYYNRGGSEGAPTDLKGPLNLSNMEKANLVAFLESLSSTPEVLRVALRAKAFKSRAVSSMAHADNTRSSP